MGEEAKKKNTLKNWLIGCGIALAVVLLLGAGMVAYMVWGVNDYMERTPVVTNNGPIMAEAGSTVSIEELATIENADEAYILESIDFVDVDPMCGAYVSEDRQDVFVGYNTGTINVYVVARGSNGETRDAVVTIQVVDAEDEQ